VRVVVQDDDIAGEGGIGSAIDLIDRVGTPLSTAHECDPNRLPCRPEFIIGGGDATFDCAPDDPSKVTGWQNSSTGFRCTDPMNPQNPDGSQRPIPVQPPTGAPGTVSGTEIRLVFNKVLNNSELEDISVDTEKQPGEQLTYTTKPGIVEVLGPDNMPIPTTVVWNSAGSATATSDVIGNPFGPALVIEIGQPVPDAMDPTSFSPSYVLEEGVKYTIVLHSDKIHDRAGNGLADQDGNPISGDFKIDFTVEDLGPFGGTTTPDITAGADDEGKFPTIATDDVISMTFINGTDALPTVTITDADDKPVAFKILAWNDLSTETCKPDPTTVDVTAVDDTGKAIAWPVGTYKLIVSAKKTSSFNSVSSFDASWTFTVDPMAKTGGATSQTKKPTPSQCVPMPPTM